MATALRPRRLMEYNGTHMSADHTKTNLCNADRSQRKHCVYFHEKTGRCTKPADGTTWQSRSGPSETAGGR